MRLIPCISLLVVSLLALAVTVSAETLPRKAQLLGVARSNGAETLFDKRLQGELDQLLPQLKNLDPDVTLLIEAFYPETKGRNKTYQIEMAFSLAEEVHHYLKQKLSPDRNLFVKIWENADPASQYSKVRITAYPRNYFEN